MSEVHVPTELIDVLWLRDGRRVLIRQVLPQDAELQQRLVRGLSIEARRHRFFAPIRELPREWLQRMTRVDHRLHVALIAEVFDGRQASAVAEVRYVVGEREVVEFALCVADAWQGRGLGRRLLARLRTHAREAGLARLVGEVLATNQAMLALARRARFDLRRHPDDARLVEASCTLVQVGPVAVRRGRGPTDILMPAARCASAGAACATASPGPTEQRLASITASERPWRSHST
jgi:acetyltransferase